MKTVRASFFATFMILFMVCASKAGMTESSVESSYFSNQISKKANFEFSISKENNRYFVDSKGERNSVLTKASFVNNDSQLLGLAYIQALNENSIIKTGAKFEKREFQGNGEISDQMEGGSNSIIGFRNIFGNYKYGQRYESFTAVYGIELVLTPGRRAESLKGNSEFIEDLNPANNFVGYHALSPYLGVESYFGSIAVGANMIFSQYIDINTSRNPTLPLTTILEGFVEVPLNKKWDIGMLGSIGRGDFAFDKMFLGGRKNETLASAYVDYKLDSDNRVSLHLKSEDRFYPYTESNTGVGLVLKRNL